MITSWSDLRSLSTCFVWSLSRKFLSESISASVPFQNADWLSGQGGIFKLRTSIPWFSLFHLWFLGEKTASFTAILSVSLPPHTYIGWLSIALLLSMSSLYWTVKNICFFLYDWSKYLFCFCFFNDILTFLYFHYFTPEDKSAIIIM